MLDKKLINDTIKMFECCSEAGHCNECPIHGYPGVECVTAAPQLGLKVIKGLLERLDLAEECIYAVDDALYSGNRNDYASEAIAEWERKTKEIEDV